LAVLPDYGTEVNENLPDLTWIFQSHRELGAACGRNQKCLLKEQDVAPLQYRGPQRVKRLLLKRLGRISAKHVKYAGQSV